LVKLIIRGKKGGGKKGYIQDPGGKTGIGLRPGGERHAKGEGDPHFPGERKRKKRKSSWSTCTGKGGKLSLHEEKGRRASRTHHKVRKKGEKRRRPAAASL